METAISYIKVMPETLSEIDNFVGKVLDEIQPREHLPLLARLTAMEKMIEKLKDGIKEKVLDEASLNSEKSFIIDGVRYEKRTKTTYSYDHCQAYAAIKEQLKALEHTMKNIKSPVADTETGEIIEPAHTKFMDYIAITLKK